MPFTPESMLAATKLTCPRATDPYDVDVNLDYATTGLHVTEKRFNVIWPGHDHWSIDPVIEMLIPLRKPYRKQFDLHIGIDAITNESHDGVLVYRFNYGPNERSNVDPRILKLEIDAAAPLILNDLNDLFQTWSEADNGLCLYLKSHNISSIHQFLESQGLRSPDHNKDSAVKMSKEQRRAAFLAAHPEFTGACAKKRRVKKEPQPTPEEEEFALLGLGHA